MEAIKEKSKSKKKTLSEYQAAPSVIGLNYSETYAIVHTNMKTPKRVEIPEALMDVSLCRAYIWYLQSPAFVGKSRSSKYEVSRQVEDFFEFLLEFLTAPDYRIPSEIIAHYKSWMIRNKTSWGTNTIYQYTSTVKIILGRISTSSSLPESLQDPVFRVCLASSSTKKFQRTSSRDDTAPVLSLVQLFPECAFDDTEMIHSLKVISSFIILEFDRIRHLLLDRPEIQAAMEELGILDIGSPPVSVGVINAEGRDSKHTKEVVDDSRRLYRVLWSAILEIDDPLMLELVSINFIPTTRRHLFAGHHPTSKQIKEAMNLFLKDAELHHNGWHEGLKSQVKLSVVSALTYRHLLMPTDIEIFAMQCLLASDRIQRSGLDAMNIEDINLDDGRLQSAYFKNRRRLSDRYTNTLMYSGLLHATAQIYKLKIKNIQTRLPMEQQGRALPYFTDKLKAGALGVSRNMLSDFYALLANPDSVFHNLLISSVDVEKSDSEPFLWLLRKVMANNKKHGLERSEYEKQSKRADKEGDPKPMRSAVVKTSEVSIAPNYIGKSTSNIASGTEVSLKGENNNNNNQPDRELENHVIAEAHGHSHAVKIATYNERSNSKESVRSGAQFAEQVGDRFEFEAREVNNFLADKNTKVILPSDLKRLLGITTVSEDLAEIIEDLDLDAGLLGEIRHGPDKLYVATKETAAFMTLHIEHLESEVAGLIAQGHMALAMKIFEERVLLESALKQFPAHIRVAGCDLSKELDIQFPPYTELYEG